MTQHVGYRGIGSELCRIPGLEKNLESPTVALMPSNISAEEILWLAQILEAKLRELKSQKLITMVYY